MNHTPRNIDRESMGLIDWSEMNKVVGDALGWAMVQLVEAGAKGVTPISRPAPRWSAYNFSMRELGIPIETIMEPHEDNYPGVHARYVLSCDAEVQPLGSEVLT